MAYKTKTGQSEVVKTLQLISSYGFFGAERVVLELSKVLKVLDVNNLVGVFRNNHNPHLELVHEALKNGLSAKLFDCKGKVDQKTLFSLRSFLIREKIDIIHSHGYKSNIYAYLSTRKTKTKLVSTCHNWIAKDIRTRSYYLLDKLFLRRFDKVIAVSESVENQLEKVGLNEKKACLIPNGICIDQYMKGRSLRHELGFQDDDVIVGTVGRLSYEKGMEDLLRVARMVCRDSVKTYFLIVGDGPLEQELMRIRDEYRLGNRVIFAGQRNDIVDIYKTFDLFILTSLNEGLPMVILEAMASKVPIISSRVGGIPSVIKNDESGYLVDSRDVEGFREAINKLADDKEIAERFKQNAFTKVTKEFSSRTMALKYLQEYKKILIQNGRMDG